MTATSGRAMQTLEREFGDTVPIADFVVWTEWALARVGFRPSNCLPIVAVCRDELMADTDDAITDTWGRCFHVGSLGGMVFAGRTGLAAALGHVPGEDGRHRFATFCLPHIGIDADGVVGRVQRRGMHRESAACGALADVITQLQAGALDRLMDADDIEQSLLRARLAPAIDAGDPPSLRELTELVRAAASDDLRRYVELARDHEPVDVAYISGIVVHLPGNVDHVASVRAEVVIDGTVINLPH
jgi:hypothetical protein